MAVVEGGAVGGGAELATACDFRIMHKAAKIRFKHILLGLTPGWGGGSRLTSIVGRRHALRMMAGAVAVDATEALRTGLVDEVVEMTEEEEEGEGDLLDSDAVRKCVRADVCG